MQKVINNKLRRCGKQWRAADDTLRANYICSGSEMMAGNKGKCHGNVREIHILKVFWFPLTTSAASN